MESETLDADLKSKVEDLQKWTDKANKEMTKMAQIFVWYMPAQILVLLLYVCIRSIEHLLIFCPLNMDIKFSIFRLLWAYFGESSHVLDGK